MGCCPGECQLGSLCRDCVSTPGPSFGLLPLLLSLSFLIIVCFSIIFESSTMVWVAVGCGLFVVGCTSPVADFTLLLLPLLVCVRFSLLLVHCHRGSSPDPLAR